MLFENVLFKKKGIINKKVVSFGVVLLNKVVTAKSSSGLSLILF